MKKVLFLFISLVPAAAICLLLVLTGILQFRVKTGPGPTVENEEIMRMPIVKDSSAPPDNGPAASSGRQPSQAGAEEAPFPSPSSSHISVEEVPSSGREDPVYAKALSFLSEGDKDPAEIEDRFRSFLMEELGLDEQRVERYFRMSFWKNFVTLQRDWQPREMDELKASFTKEKALKKAGFAAKGLRLITSEMDESESRYHALLEEMSAAESKKEDR